MKIQKSNYTSLQKIDAKSVKNETNLPEGKDLVSLGGNKENIDFLKLGNITGQTAGPDFSKLKTEAVPYIISGAVLGGSLAAMSSLPIAHTVFGIGGGAVVGGALASYPKVAKVTGIATVLGGAIGAGIGIANSAPYAALIGGAIGAGGVGFLGALFNDLM